MKSNETITTLKNWLGLRMGAMAATLFCLLALAIMVSPSARASIVGPYTNDFYTLHLWHLNEINGTPLNAPTNALSFDYTTNVQTVPLVLSNDPGKVNVSGWPGYPATQFALQGQPAYSYPGVANFGYSVAVTNYSCLYTPWYQPNPTLSASAIYNIGTNMSDFIATNTGAFTFEALVNPWVLPNIQDGEIFCGDGGGTRAWQFRFNDGTGAGYPYGRIEYNDISGSGTHDIFANIPSTGPDAYIPANAGTINGWYHVAITFTGFAPTNGDPASILTIYWTHMDPFHTNDDLIYQQSFPDNGSAWAGHDNPVACIGGNARGAPINNVGDGDAFDGYMSEVRISDFCRRSNYLTSPYGMAFNSTIFNGSPNIGGPITNTLVGYGQTLTLQTSVIGSVPIALQWYQNGVLLAGQTNATLVITNVTFAANGNYQLTATNSAGGTNSVIGAVTVGAAFNGVFNSGVDANGNSLWETAQGSVDPHWQLIQSADANNPGPNAIVLNGPQPVNAGVSANTSVGWIGSALTPATGTGNYAYQEQFQIDNTVINSNAVLSGYFACTGPQTGDTVLMTLNGVQTNITLANPYENKNPFYITTGLQPGSNTLVVTMDADGGYPPGWLIISVAGIGNAYPAGLPVITNEPPASQTVFAGATATIPEVTVGCPPLYYQWLSNSVPIAGATNQNLSFVATNFSPSEIVEGQFTADYQVVASSGSAAGYVTSSVSALTIQIPPLTANSAGVPIWDSATSDTNIYVLFSAAVDPTTATTLGNYSLNNSASVLSAASGSAPNEVILTTTALNPADIYTLTVQNVKNTYLIPMSPSPTNLSVGVYPAATALWVKANTGVTTDPSGVNTWNDLSGNGNTLSDSLGTPYEPQLIPSALNGQPVIAFNATNETFMAANSSTSLAITGDMSIFAVVNFATLAGGTNGEIVGKTGSSSANIPAPYDYYAQSGNVSLLRGNGTVSASVTSSNVPSTGVTHIVGVVMQGTSVTHLLDGQPNGTGTLSTVIADQGQDLYIGTRADFINRLSGNLAELIIVGSALSTNDQTSLENYLAGEYHLPIGANSYPVITQEPVASTNVNQGGTLTVPAAASGNPALAYQWYNTNNIAVAGQTSAALVINNILTNNSYYLVATNIYGAATSSVVVVTLTSGLNVSLGPPNLTVYSGQSVTLAAAATGTVPFYYQWLQGVSPILNATNATYTATATPTLTDYYCTVTNAYLGFSTTNAGPVALVGVAAPTNIYQATVLGDHPIAFWRLDEGPDNGSGDGGTIAYDYVGGHNATYTNVVLGELPGFNNTLVSTDTATAFSLYNNTIANNGSLLANSNNSYAGEIDQSGSGLPNVNFAKPAGSNAELSVEAWVWAFETVKTNRAQLAGGGIVTKGWGNGGEQFDLDDNSGFRFFVRDASGAAHALNGTINPTSNAWYHVVGVWDGANGAGHLYVNGTDNVDSVGNSLGIGLLKATTTNTALTQATLVSIGSRAQSESTTNFDLPFFGRIQDVSLYNYALSPVQVYTHYEAGVNGINFSTTPTNIVASATTNLLTLSWPRNWIGWQLQAQTNKVTAGIGGNWVNDNSVSSTSTNLVGIPIVPTNGTVFYRLIYAP